MPALQPSAARASSAAAVELCAYPPAATGGARVVSPRGAAIGEPRTYPPAAGAPGLAPALPACGVVSDCSFEAGGTGWTLVDHPMPFMALGVYAAGVTPGFGLFATTPTDGAFVAAHGFDAGSPGDIVLFQDMVLQPDAARLEFDFRAGWDMLSFSGSTLPRTFQVDLEPGGGGAPLQSTTILTAEPATMVLDTGPEAGTVDVSAFGGRSVRVVFRWHIPEGFTGPGFFQLDRVAVREELCLAIGNCSFETGSLTPWVGTDIAVPSVPLGVRAAGVTPGFGLFATAPTDGALVLAHGFGGAGPGDITLAQDVSLPAGTHSLEFDYRAGWDMLSFPGSTLPREFLVEIQPSGGGAAMRSDTILQAPPGTVVLDTGPRTGSVDVSAYAGSDVRVVFRWRVPEDDTGPAHFQLDRVTLSRAFCATISNCSFETGDFGAWTATDIFTNFYPIHVGNAGENVGFDLFITEPTDGLAALIHGFDGDGPGVITIHQDLGIPLWAELLRFDFRAGWDMEHYVGSTLPRDFVIEVQPAGGGPALASDIVLVAPPGTSNLDTGPRSRTFPVGAFAGQDVRLVFRWDVPESYTGPGLFQLDHVSLDASPLAAGPGGRGPRSLVLLPALPNPSRDLATFRFTLPGPGDVELEILDVRGARVWSGRRAALPSGEHRIVWDGRRSDGGLAPPGVYHARVRTPMQASTRMFVRVR